MPSPTEWYLGVAVVVSDKPVLLSCHRFDEFERSVEYLERLAEPLRSRCTREPQQYDVLAISG